MSMALCRLLWLLLQVFVQISVQQTDLAKVIGTKDIPVAQQTYNWDPEYRCRLLAHGSVVLQNSDHHVLVFDGGTAKYKFDLNGNSSEILDLNGWTVTIDLTKEFNTQDFGIDSQVKKAVDVPVLNRFGVWADSSQNSIYIQGGHFYTAPGWNESQYHINDSAIPAYSIWKFDLPSQKWTNVTGSGNNKNKFERALGGAAVSVPSTNQSFYVGGIVTSRSDPTAEPNLFVPQAGMLVYEHDNDNLYNETYGSNEEQGYGFWHGSLNHMQLGQGKGFLISIMGETAIAGVTRPDAPEVNDETGIPVTFDHVLFYNLDKNKWYKQKTTYIDDDLPVTRTRFCGQTVYSKDTNTWELWIYGGQLVDNKGAGVDDIYVLSMPSFIWTKVGVPQGEYHTRSHSCHALGSQLLVVGGYPPGFSVDPSVACSTELIRVFDMNKISWKSSYELDTVYSTPQVVRDHAELDAAKRDPYLKPWADPALEVAFDYTPASSTQSPVPTSIKPRFATWKIAVIVIFVLIALTAIAYFVIKRKRSAVGHTPVGEYTAGAHTAGYTPAGEYTGDRAVSIQEMPVKST